MEFLIRWRSDAALVRRALAGDAAASETLVLRYQRRAHAIARASGVGFDAAEDVVQEAFLRAFRDLASLRDPARFGPWFLTIVRNEARSALRRSGRVETSEGLDALAGPDPQPLEAKEFQESVWRRVSELPEGLREAILLYYHEGESVRAVARALGISIAAAKDRLRRGRDILRERLWRELRDELRGDAPSPREWQRRGRRLALLAMATLATSTAKLAAAGATGAATATAGGIIMSGKKLAIVASIGVIIVAGGVVVTIGTWDPRRESERPSAAPVASERPVAATKKALDPDAKAERAPGVEPSGEIASEISIAGRVVSAGRGLDAARILAMEVSAWSAMAEEERAKAETSASREDLPAEMERLRKVLLDAAKAMPEAVSKEGGAFAFRGLSEGTYRLYATRDGFLPNDDTASVVRVGSPARTTIELVPALSIAGKVIDASGAAVAAARIEAEDSSRAGLEGVERLERQRDEWLDGAILCESAPAESAADGTFRIDGIEATHYDLTATAEGYLDGKGFRIAAGSRDVVLVLDRGASIAGRVVDPGRRPVAGARVRLSSAMITEVHQLFDWRRVEFAGLDEGPATSTDEGGRFRLRGIGSGSFDLAVFAEGFPSLKKEVAVSTDPVDVGDLVLDAPRTISGTVVDPDGRAVAGARVWVPEARKGVRPSNWFPRSGGEAIAETRSQAGGAFTLSGLPDGAFDVRATAEGFADAVAESVAAGTADARLVLQAGLAIHGKVIDAETSSPVAGAEVRVGREFEFNVKSDEQGRFVVRGYPLFEGERRGTAFVRASHPDIGSYESYNVTVLGRDEKTPLIVPLSRPERITGRVRDAEGHPAAAARIRILVTGLSADAMGYNPAKDVGAASGPDGAFSIEAPVDLRRLIDVPRFFVIASHPALGSGRAGPYAVPAVGEPWPDVEIALGRSAIEGTVTAEDGTAIEGARIAARPAAGGEDSTAWSRPDGGYRISMVEPGPSVVRASALGFAPKTIEGTEVGEGTVPLDIVLSRGGAIEGRVRDAGGNPLAQVEVVALPAEKEGGESDEDDASEYVRRMHLREAAGLGSVRTGADGRFRLENLPDGAYWIAARAPGYEADADGPFRPGATGVDLVLARFSAISGIVVAADTREPISHFKIDILDRKKLADWAASPRGMSFDYRVASEGELVFDHPAGRFLYDGLRPGSYVILVRADGFVFTTRDVTLDPGKEAPIEVALDRGGRVDGVVLDAETGLPVPGVGIGLGMATPADGTVRPYPPGAQSLADGTFSIGGLPDGAYALFAQHPFYQHGQASMVTIPRADDRPIEIKLAPAGRIEGRIRGASRAAGKRFVQSTLKLEKTDADSAPSMPPMVGMDADGWYSADSLVPGSYRLVLTRYAAERGEMVHIGPSGGYVASNPVGPEETLVLGEVRIRPRETTVCDVTAPPAPEAQKKPGE